MLHIQMLGELTVRVDGAAVTLPPSRKARALLAYLAVQRRPQRRDRLCELLWARPDDPRGALRWTLSRLRAALGPAADGVLVADRQAVSMKAAPDQVDLLQIREALRGGIDGAATEALEALASAFTGLFLEGLDLPSSPELQSWIAASREEVRRTQAAVLTALDDRLAATPERALPYARALAALDPADEDGWARLVERLAAAGRGREAEAQYEAARAALADFGGAGHRLERARRRGPSNRAPGETSQAALRQEIRFCRADGGARIAYALAGDGPPLVKAANWMNHLEYDWESPIWGHFFRGLAQDHRLIRYDARGNGLSDWEVDRLDLDVWVRDLEAVVDAAGVNRFPLLGVSQGCAISIAYAVRHPERVSRLILYAGQTAGTYARGDDPVAVEQRRALTTLMRTGWGQDNPAFRQIFTSTFAPEATREQADAFNELQRRTASPDCAARYHEAVGWLDVRPLLDQVAQPTLVLHPRGDRDTPVERGRELAAGIPGARFVALPGQNHLFLEGEPAAERFFEEVRLFLAAD